jgi:hypothetical protein
LHANANVDKAKNDGATPFYMAAQNGYVGAMKLLLKHGAQPDTQNNKGGTPLDAAAANGHTAAARLLLSRLPATAVNAKRGSEQRTALHYAAINGHAGTVELLLFNGADPKMTFVVQPSGTIMTALDVAKHNKHPLCVAALAPRTIACLQRWSVATHPAYPVSFRHAVAVLLRQVSLHCPPGIAPDRTAGIFGLGRMPGMASCEVTDPITKEKRTVDLLQEFILEGGMLNVDWWVCACLDQRILLLVAHVHVVLFPSLSPFDSGLSGTRSSGFGAGPRRCWSSGRGTGPW